MRCASTFLHCAFSKVHISFLLFCTVFALFCTFFCTSSTSGWKFIKFGWVQTTIWQWLQLSGCRTELHWDLYSTEQTAKFYFEFAPRRTRFSSYIQYSETVLNSLCTDDNPWYTLKVVLGQLGLKLHSVFQCTGPFLQCSPGCFQYSASFHLSAGG